MKTFSIAATTVALAGSAVAFPAAMLNPESGFAEFLEKMAAPDMKRDIVPRQTPGFDANAQRVSTTGDHAYKDPVAGDDRGMCPGLNAMANHNYLPRNGRATAQQFVDGTYAAFGMNQDLANFLAYFGAFVDGDGSSWSIQGAQRTGIGGSHNNYETDSSPLKSDLFQYGAHSKLIMTQFMNLYNRQPDPATANYDLTVMRDFRGHRYQESIQKNPYFAYQPFPGILVSQAAFTFIYRFMGNKSAAAPAGILNKDVLKTFMSITGPENNLTWTFGHERFPDVFYKRAVGDEYSIPYFFQDIGFFAQKYPEIFSVGCNTGKVNSFVSIPPEQLTGGAMNAKQVAANPLCFGFQMASSKVFAAGGVTLANAAKLNTLVSKALTNIGLGPCPLILAPTVAPMQAVCPGFQGFYGGPFATAAPGAIQDP